VPLYRIPPKKNILRSQFFFVDLLSLTQVIPDQKRLFIFCDLKKKTGSVQTGAVEEDDGREENYKGPLFSALAIDFFFSLSLSV